MRLSVLGMKYEVYNTYVHTCIMLMQRLSLHKYLHNLQFHSDKLQQHRAIKDSRDRNYKALYFVSLYILVDNRIHLEI